MLHIGNIFRRQPNRSNQRGSFWGGGAHPHHTHRGNPNDGGKQYAGKFKPQDQHYAAQTDDDERQFVGA